MPVEIETPVTLKMLALPSCFAGIAVTSDGYFLARERGEITYNVFLGKPLIRKTGNAADYRRTIWASLNDSERETVKLDWSRLGLPQDNLI